MRPNGYISFQYELTPYLKYDNEENSIAVKVDNSKQPNSRWYSGSGIYRNVWLTTVNKLHVGQWGTFISTSNVSEKTSTVNINTEIKNQYSSNKAVILKTIIYDASGKQVATSSANTTVNESTSENKNSNQINQSFKINNPKLWSIDLPYLYKAVSQIILYGKIVDTYETKFGIRYFNFDPDKGFFLNGKHVKILGVCDHHDLGALGSAIIWSVGNEIPEQGGDAAKGDTSGRVIARELVSIVKALDTTREIVTANDETGIYNNIIQSGAFDLIGYNYHHNEWAGFHKRWPGKKMIVTESTSALETRGYYDLVPFDSIRRWPERSAKPFTNPLGGYTVSAYDNVSTPWGSTHEESVKALLKSDHVSGMFIWTGFDYLGEPTPFSWPARSSYFGIIDLAGFPKDVYYMYQSVFTTKPVLHIYPHWNWKKGDTVDVIGYYNNADEVELFLNNKSLGIRKKSGNDLHVKWAVPFEPGTLKAISRKKGKTVLVKEVKTAGAPAKIILKADRNNINADGKDLSFITATIVDKDGITVPDADNLIHSGDPVSHESFKGDKHTALNGLALAILQSDGKKGKIILTANAKGLEGASVIVEGK